MRRRTKLILILSIIVLLFAFAGCGKSNKKAEVSSSATSELVSNTVSSEAVSSAVSSSAVASSSKAASSKYTPTKASSSKAPAVSSSAPPIVETALERYNGVANYRNNNIPAITSYIFSSNYINGYNNTYKADIGTKKYLWSLADPEISAKFYSLVGYFTHDYIGQYMYGVYYNDKEMRYFLDVYEGRGNSNNNQLNTFEIVNLLPELNETDIINMSINDIDDSKFESPVNKIPSIPINKNLKKYYSSATIKGEKFKNFIKNILYCPMNIIESYVGTYRITDISNYNVEEVKIYIRFYDGYSGSSIRLETQLKKENSIIYFNCLF